MKPFWSVPSLCPRNNRAPGKQCGKRGGGKLGRDGEAGEEREQPHSCPGTPQFLGIQKLGQGGGISQRIFIPKENEAGAESWMHQLGQTHGWTPGCTDPPGKRIPRERPAPGRLLSTWLRAPLENLGYQRPGSLGNGTKAGALMINSAKSCGFFIPKAPGSSGPM